MMFVTRDRKKEMTDREAYVAFNLISSIGAVTVARLAAASGGSVAQAYARYPDKRDRDGKEPSWEREMDRAMRQNVKLITLADPDYPPLLREIASPPLVLYVTGSPDVLSEPGVALVGTRTPSAYGRETAGRLAEGLVRRGWHVISGLAMGIDAAAHRGALDGGGRTVGVLGGSLDCFYPDANRGLAREMVAAGGCVVSEFPFGRNPDVQTFPQRNRIVSGLSRGVVAVECPLRSGTMITCMRAAEQGRPVMAVPGRIDWKAAGGCLHLIREGARLVTGVDDILEDVMELGKTAQPPQTGAVVRPGRPRTVPVKPPAAAVPEVPLSAEEARVLRAVPAGGATRDAVAQAAEVTAGRVNALLVALRIKGRVRFCSGNRVELVS